jgi:glutamyl-tRNA synthetase
VSNTPKQINILRGLGADVPVYAHVPNVNGGDGRKLSKRHGAVTVEEFRANGYLPEALVNFLALLGWSYDDRTTIMSRQELVDRYTLERVGASPATFDYEKLDWMNGVYLRAMSPEEYGDALVGYLRDQGYDWPEERIRATVPLVQEKIERLDQFTGYAGFLFQPVDPDAAQLDGGGATLRAAVDTLRETEPFDAEHVETALRALADRLGQKPRDTFVPIRIAVTGSKVSPGLFESIELLGREETLERLEAAAARAA